MSDAAGSDFITGEEIAGRLGELLDRADELKADRPGTGAGTLAGRSVALIFEHYEQFDSRHKSLLPMRRVYVPEPIDEGAE